MAWDTPRPKQSGRPVAREIQTQTKGGRVGAFDVSEAASSRSDNRPREVPFIISFA